MLEPGLAESLRLQVEGRELLCPCLEVVLYQDAPLGPGARQFYEKAWETLGARLTFYQTESMKGWSRIDAAAGKLVPTWVARPRVGKTYFVEFRGGLPAGTSDATLKLFLLARPEQNLTEQQRQQRQEALRKFFEEQKATTRPPVDTLRVTFPLDHPLAEPRKLLEWVLSLDLVQKGPFLGGHAGLALNFDDSVVDASLRDLVTSRLANACLTHPGLGWDNIGAIRQQLLRWDREAGELVPQVKRANWLTLVSDRTVARLGGREKVQAALAGGTPPVTVHPLAGGLLLQAGPAPAPGNVLAGDYLPAYRRVAQVLRPFRLERHPGPGRGFSDEAAQEWLEAFDRPLP